MGESVAVTVTVDSSLRGRTVALGGEWREWPGEPGKPVVVQAGFQRVRALLQGRARRGPGQEVHLSPGVARRLRLRCPAFLHLRCSRSSSGLPVLRLGPVVGILTSQGGVAYRRFVREARREGVEAFVFRPGGVRWRRRVVYGYYPVGAGWRRRLFPLPDVVYDRDFGLAWMGYKRRLFRLLRRLGGAAFNEGVGYKWTIHRRLWAHPFLRPHLPQTLVLRSPRTVLRMLQRHRLVFLKPCRGHQGLGVYRLGRLGGGRFSFKSYARRRAAILTTRGVVGLARRLARYRVYLVQQGVLIPRVRGSVWDVRVLMSRNAAGDWEMAGVAVRVGGKGKIVSNLHRGGRAVQLERFLRSRLRYTPAEVERVCHDIRQVATTVARQLQRFAPRTGDLGIDLAVDREKRVWVIEVNPKPGRRCFQIVGNRDVVRAVHGLPFAYARHLAGFGSSGEVAQEK